MKNDQNNSSVLTKNRYVPTTEFYSQVIDCLDDYSIFTLDNDSKINSWNSGATKIFGYESEEVIGKAFDIIFTEEDKIKGIPKTEIDTAIKKGRAQDVRWHISKNGELFYAQGLVFPITGVKGEKLGFVKILLDITEKKKSEDSIKKYVKELEDLIEHKESILAILSHDLRSPLTGIIGVSSYLKSNFEEMARIKINEMLGLLHNAAKTELNMLDNLVEWARIKYAAEAFSPTEIELGKNVNTVFESLNEVALVNKVKLHNDIDRHICVFADQKMLVSVLQNIISNAIKHSHQAGEIWVKAKKKGDKIIVEIKDTGVGMSNKAVEKLFSPQTDTLSQARKDNKGAGIGLLLAKGFLEKNGGEIWAESKEGQGSSFYFNLPISRRPETGIL